MRLRAFAAGLLATAMLAACGTKGPLYLPKKDPAQSGKTPPAPALEPVPETTNKPAQ